MSRWKITIEYDGRNYAGFQVQPGLSTIQGEIERSIKQFSGQDIGITVAGRTDAGVHAKAQVAHFDFDYRYEDGSPREMSGFELAKAINAQMIDQPISIIDAQIVDDEFHARFDAQSKTYHYRILNRPYKAALESGLAWWFKRELDVPAMVDASEVLVGHHDFTSFRDTDCQAKSPERTIDAIQFKEEKILNGKMITMAVEGRSFLHHQVRNIVGTLSLVGEGKWAKGDVQRALDAKDRTAAGPTAPSDGLYLVNIIY